MTAAPTSNQCVDCEIADMRNTSRPMLGHGFVLCRRKEKHHFESLTRPQQCPMFAAAPAERSTERREWLKEQGITK